MVTPLPTELFVEDELVVEPEVILSSRYDMLGHLEIFIRWKGLPAHEMSWMQMKEAVTRFPLAKHEDKLIFCIGVLIGHGERTIGSRGESWRESTRKRTTN